MDEHHSIENFLQIKFGSSQGLDNNAVEDLLDSDVAIEEGLIDGLFTSLGQDGDNILSWGHATHVGCGWIQFPTSISDEDDEKKDRSFENFMVCNYGIGVPQNTTCDGSGGPGSEQPSYVTYYEAPFDVIADVKKCLKARYFFHQTKQVLLNI